MRILVLSDEVWNDKINGNNVVSNWFEDFDAEFANIYLSPEKPYNSCCSRYFQVTDIMMLKSIFSLSKAGHSFEISLDKEGYYDDRLDGDQVKLYAFLKSISGNTMRVLREVLWSAGKYDISALKKFVLDFNPDIIFTERLASNKILRLERIICSITSCPIVAFTGDDEYSLKQLNFSPLYWLNRFILRKNLKKNVQKYSIYYTLSEEQKAYYEKEFGCKAKILHKCGTTSDEFIPHNLNAPIKIVYAGKLYCNRWKVLASLASGIKKINKTGQKFILLIYTKDKITSKQEKLLNDGCNSMLMGSVTQEKLKKIYDDSDIALHVESQDIKNRLLTRFSFSTKIVDCINSGCAVMAICWEQHSGYTYLKKEKAAFCIPNESNILLTLERIANNPNIIEKYAKKAWECAQRNHNKEKIQQMLFKDFTETINNDK